MPAAERRSGLGGLLSGAGIWLQVKRHIRFLPAVVTRE